jgi:hypothetical protein
LILTLLPMAHFLKTFPVAGKYAPFEQLRFPFLVRDMLVQYANMRWLGCSIGIENRILINRYLVGICAGCSWPVGFCWYLRLGARGYSG